ncbi:tetratricopeptide repeat protein [Shimia sp. Alg240-R146]|uniref:tetratricopeptide repeat protein n=1 Tax=Shimia sp. Alg240-R146 TaxID=2993449 RepID=UPI0022E1D160|nr:hypothetical protein [Shimia sp. Alg240-R146]
MRSILVFALTMFVAASAFADTQRGIAYFNSENYSAAEQEFAGPVTEGDPVAIRYYANMLYFGRGVAEDRPQAKKLLRDAHAKGDTASGTYLASLLTDYWAHFGTSELTEADLVRLQEAKVLFEETYSGPTGQNPASKIVDIYFDTKGRVAPKDNMIVWLKRAVLEGHAYSALQLASAYSSGNGVEEDKREAFYWAEYAAFLGNAEAQTIVGQVYAEGRFGPVRQDEGFALIVQSAKERHNPAMLYVAEHFASSGSNRDLGMAWRVLHLGYDRGMEKSERSQRLADFLLSRGADRFGAEIEDFMYNGHFETLIQETEPDYNAALDDFSSRIKPHSE